MVGTTVKLTLWLALGVSLIVCLCVVAGRGLGALFNHSPILMYATIEHSQSQQPYLLFLADTGRNLSSPVRLQNINNDLYPACSSGGQVAVTNLLSDNRGIFVTDSFGSRILQVTDSVSSTFYPRWSPDGTRLAFVSSLGGQSDIYVTAFGDDPPQKISNGVRVNSPPVWSPDGAQLLFTGNRDTEFRQLYAVAVDTRQQRKLTKSESNTDWPAWSPNGRHIVFSAFTENNFELYVMDSAGENLHRLTATDVRETQPVWSPDGKSIAYWSSAGGLNTNSQLYVMKTDGTNPRLVANGRMAGGAPLWSADSRLLAFVAESRGEFAIFLASVDGHDYWQVSRVGARDAASPSWCS